MNFCEYNFFICESGEESLEDKVLADEMESSDASEGEREIVQKSKYKGLYKTKSGWTARGVVNQKQIYLASGTSEEDCAEAVRQKVHELRSRGSAVHTDYGSLINQPVT